MFKQSLKQALAAAGLALASVFAAVSSAQAAVVVSFDPAYGSAIPNLGFKGTATLDVNPNCIGGPSGFGTGYVSADTLASEGCYVSVLSFHIDFYNTQIGASSVFSTIDQRNVPDTRLIINEVFFNADGILSGIGTSDSSIFRVDLEDVRETPATSVSYHGFMALFFESGNVIPTAGFNGGGTLSASTPGVGGARLTTCTAADTEFDACSHITTSNLATPTFTPVPDVNAAPEPGSLALVGAALAGLGLARRRRARR